MSQLQRRKVDWSSLPNELLEKIAYSSGSRIELLRFRAVCKKWRSSYTSPVSTYLLYPTLPKPIPFHPSSIFIKSNRPIYIVGSALYLIQPHQDSDPRLSSKSWVVSIEELNQRRFRVRYPLTKKNIDDLPNNFPRSINILDFQATHIGDGLKLCFSNGNEDIYRFEGFTPCCNYPTKSKVVLFHDDDSPTFDTWSVMVLLLCQGGSLGTLKFNGQWNFIDKGPGFRFDDVISLRRDGQLCGIDREGRAYLIDGSECRVIRTMSDTLCNIHNHCYARESRKFLVLIWSLVFMIVRNGKKFELYLLQEEKHDWIKMSDIGDLVLFMTLDNVVPVKAKNIPGCRGNCIVFPKNMFALHSQEFCKDYKLFQGTDKYSEVGVYYLDENHCRLVSSEPGLSELFGIPPSWVSPDSDSESQTWDSDEDMDDFSNADSIDGSEEAESPVAYQCADGGTGAVQGLSQPATQGDKSQQEISDEKNSGLVPVESCPNETPEECEDVGSEDIFNGLEISPDLTPVLHKIWAKYGNVIEEHAVCSNGLLTWALESLAKMIVILENQTCLSTSEAEYLKSTLVDLQSMNFKLDWLVPYVESALALYNNKEQIDAVTELETTRSKLQEELHELEGKLADQKKLVRENIENLAISTPLIL